MASGNVTSWRPKSYILRYTMKKILISFIILFVTSCSNFSPIASDICKISEEICYYANAICDLYGNLPDDSDDENVKANLLNSSVILKNIYSKSIELKRDENKLLNKSEVIHELILIRNQLKSTYEKLQQR